MGLLEQHDDERFKCLVPKELIHVKFDVEDDQIILPQVVEKPDLNLKSVRTKAFLQSHPRNGFKVSR